MKRLMEHPMRQIILSLMLVSAALIVFRAAAADTPARATTVPSQASKVSITNFSFQPAVLTVKAGTKVIWINHDSTPHTVTSSDQHFTSSGGLDTNDQYSVVFDKPGTYEYFCSLHPMMIGEVIVQSAR